jgi:hypothetical protein
MKAVLAFVLSVITALAIGFFAGYYGSPPKPGSFLLSAFPSFRG